MNIKKNIMIIDEKFFIMFEPINVSYSMRWSA